MSNGNNTGQVNIDNNNNNKQCLTIDTEQSFLAAAQVSQLTSPSLESSQQLTPQPLASDLPLLNNNNKKTKIKKAQKSPRNKSDINIDQVPFNQKSTKNKLFQRFRKVPDGWKRTVESIHDGKAVVYYNPTGTYTISLKSFLLLGWPKYETLTL